MTGVGQWHDEARKNERVLTAGTRGRRGAKRDKSLSLQSTDVRGPVRRRISARTRVIAARGREGARQTKSSAPRTMES